MKCARKIILYPNAKRDIGFKTALDVKERLSALNRHSVICYVPEGDTVDALPEGIETKNLEDELPNAQMIITFGGDGTILRAARETIDVDVPILGVNMGGKGFMAEIEPTELSLIDDVAKGKYTIENRMMLDVEIHRFGHVVYRDFALNDVVVRGDHKVIDLILFGDRQQITAFSGDGAVISTPTGSTAYSMAAGGPIVEEAAQNIILTPICPHVIEAKSFVLMPDRKVTVELGKKRNNPAFISVDGGNHLTLESTDVVFVAKSSRYTQLVRLSNRSFYKKVSEKLGERP